MARGDPMKPNCAFCKFWNGDAQLSSKNVAKGFLQFDSYAKGNCTVGQNPIMKIANEGSGCKYFISIICGDIHIDINSQK